MNLIGLHTAGHDCGLSFIDSDGDIKICVESESITRKRHESSSQPALDYFFNRESYQDLSNIEIALSTPVRYSEFGLFSEKANIENLTLDSPCYITKANLNDKKVACTVVLHEMAHICCALQANEWSDDTLILINEGHGTLTRNLFAHYKNGKITILESNKLPWYASGFGWYAIAFLMGFSVTPSIAGTIMAMSAYGKYSNKLASLIKSIDTNFVNFDREKQFTIAEKLKKQLLPNNNFSEKANLASTLQALFSEEIIRNVKKFMSLTRAKHLVLGGGCALNIVTNTRLRDLFPTLNIWPACNDSGLALGAALYVRKILNNKNINTPDSVRIQGSRDDLEVLDYCSSKWNRTEYSTTKIIDQLSQGKVVAYAEGMSSVGPRSLGERSLIGLPNITGMKNKISMGIKKREWYRPLSPIVTTDSLDTLNIEFESKYMLFQHYDSNPSAWPEATHENGTSRLQTLPNNELPQMHELISELHTKGISRALINTSLNCRGESIALTSTHVLDTITKMKDVDVAVINDSIFTKK